MPHSRKRHALTVLTKMGRYWPVVGLLGLRQAGKSTILRDQLGIGNHYTLDDEDVAEDMRASAKNFLIKVGSPDTPLLVDEAQKAPALFDAIKLLVDRKKRPGSFWLTGSSAFSSKVGIRESLTGRIGLLHLYPFTLAEAHGAELDSERAVPFANLKARFKCEQALERLAVGGLPVPLFTRDREQRLQYARSWLETSILRDAARVFGRGYDPDVAWSILRQLGSALREGELPTLSHFKQSSRALRKYLESMENIFVLRKLPCHEAGVGKDAWLPSDGGLAREIMGSEAGEGATISLGRVFVWNEILANAEYSGNPLRPLYYKSARSAPVDLVWNDTLIKVSALPKSRLSYDERPLAGALKKLELKRGVLAVPRDDFEFAKNGIGVVPWTHWS